MRKRMLWFKKGVPFVTIACKNLKSPATNAGMTAAAPADKWLYFVVQDNDIQVPKVHDGHAAKGGSMHGMYRYAVCMGQQYMHACVSYICYVMHALFMPYPAKSRHHLTHVTDLEQLWMPRSGLQHLANPDLHQCIPSAIPGNQPCKTAMNRQYIVQRCARSNNEPLHKHV